MARRKAKSDGDSFSGVTTDQVTILGDGFNVPLYAVTQQSGKGLLTGGAVWSGIGFVFNVTDLTYFIDGVNYTASATQVTLTASHPTDDRFDYIVVDDTGTVSVVTGTPGTPPAVPTLDWNEVGVTIVLVEAGSTTPTILQDLIYNENTGSPTEWVTSIYNITGTQTGTVVFNSTDNPYSGTLLAQATATNLRRGMRFTRGTDISIQQFGYVALAFRIDGVALPTSKSPIIRFQNSSGTLIGNSVNLVTYGLDRTVVGTWQLVVIPVSAFGNIINVRSLTAVVNGTGNASWSMDKIFLSGAIPPQGVSGPVFLSATGTLYSQGAGAGATGVADSIFLGTNTGFQATGADVSIFQGKNAGYGATSANNSIFFGLNSGYKATFAENCVFIGESSGSEATNAYSALFMGKGAGQNAAFANRSVFLGVDTGKGATNAFLSTFIGNKAGENSTNAAQSIFIGSAAGRNDTVNNTASGTSILIGNSASTGGFKDSIGLGTEATNTAVNQLMIGSATSPINQVVVKGTGAIQVPVGTTAQRIATQGAVRYNTTTSKFEGYNGTTWVDLN